MFILFPWSIRLWRQCTLQNRAAITALKIILGSLMDIDLNSQFKLVFEYAVNRIQTFSTANHAGPGKAGENISFVQFGYEVEEANWVELILSSVPGMLNPSLVVFADLILAMTGASTPEVS